MVKGWIEKPIGELFDISGGVSASRAQLSVIGFPYLHYGDIHGSKRTFVDVSVDNTIPQLDIPLTRVSRGSLLQDGDVVFVDASEDDEGASRHIVVRNDENKPFISGLHTIVAKAKTNELCNNFREFCFQTSAVKAQFKFYAVGTKVVGVSKTSIKNIDVFFPLDKTEQRSIATALSDADAFIYALERLLAKKRNVKQGIMQELLTSKRRLPGFAGEWVEKPLGNATVSISSGITRARENNGKYHLYGSTGLIGFTNSPDYSGKKILIARVGANAGTINIVDGIYGVSDNTLIVELNEGYDLNFMYSQLSFYGLNRLIFGSGQPLITGSQLKKLEVSFPPTKDEQIAIATVLSDMNAEIDSLAAKLAKARYIKQGMMSELLTGNIRLTEEGAGHG